MSGRGGGRGGQVLTLGDLHRLAGRFAAVLRDKGVERVSGGGGKGGGGRDEMSDREEGGSGGQVFTLGNLHRLAGRFAAILRDKGVGG